MPGPLFIFAQPPNTPAAREGMEALLACAAFDQQPSVVFMEHGIYQLLPQGESPGVKNLNKMAQALSLYGVDPLYICENSLIQRGIHLSMINLNGTLIDTSQRKHLINQATWVVRF